VVAKNGVLEHKSGKISETRKDRRKVTIDGLLEVTNALSNSTYGLFFLKIRGSQPTPENSIAIISGTGKATKFERPILYAHI